LNFREICFKVKRHLKRDVNPLLIGLWCKDGRRSSVAVAELIFAILSWERKAGDGLQLEHTAMDEHKSRHNGCAACEASSVNVVNYQAAKDIWDKAIQA